MLQNYYFSAPKKSYFPLRDFQKVSQIVFTFDWQKKKIPGVTETKQEYYLNILIKTLHTQ